MKLLYHPNKRLPSQYREIDNTQMYYFLMTLRIEPNNYNYNVYHFSRVSI